MDFKKAINKLQRNLKTIKLKLEISSLQTFFNKRMQYLQTIIQSPSPNDETLHQVRKTLKDMQYVLVWCAKNYPEGKKAIKEISIAALKKLGELVGEYNDRRIELLLLDTYLQEEKNKKEARAAKKYRQQLLQYKAKLKKRLLRQVTQLYMRFSTKSHPVKINNHRPDQTVNEDSIVH